MDKIAKLEWGLSRGEPSFGRVLILAGQPTNGESLKIGIFKKIKNMKFATIIYIYLR
jgi:hypothetical protein